MKNYEEDHKIAFKDTIKMHPYGDPDCGSGWYSNKLSYTEWYKLNCAKRAY